jgi:cytochrome c peroxidase
VSRLPSAIFASVILWFVAFALALSASPTSSNVDPLTPQERLGKLLFFDMSLSARGNQSCASCHGPSVGWTGPDTEVNQHAAVYEGSIAGRFGNRKPPSAAYATFAPRFHMMRPPRPFFVGGNFWDGRATGAVLGTPAADQAMGPFLNPVEQALPDAQTLVRRVCTGPYAELFIDVWGADACDSAERGYRAVALSIAAYEASSEVNPFNSKYDAYLEGRAELSAEEELGRVIRINARRTGDRRFSPTSHSRTWASRRIPRTRRWRAGAMKAWVGSSRLPRPTGTSPPRSADATACRRCAMWTSARTPRS